MSGTEWAALVAAAFFALAVLVLCVVLLNVFRLISELGNLVRGITEETVPLIGGVGETVSGVNVELARVDAVVAGVQRITDRADATMAVIQATIVGPLIKVAAYGSGVAAAWRAAVSAQRRS
ncbi:MAG: DUF948 domain-containing protein [Actinobacteria bacterium]|nr:DUF948 domain-containing protein [Actinomycetota bacterium]